MSLGKVIDIFYVKDLYEWIKLFNGVIEYKYKVGLVIVIDRSNGLKEMLYLYKDNLGLIVLIINVGGNIV